MTKVANALIGLCVLVNLGPVVGVLGAERLRGLYGLAFEDPNLLVLMRHRALLFGVVGMLLVAALFRPELRLVAMVAGLFSMLSFVAIALLASELNPELRRVMWIDVVASVALAGAFILDRIGSTTR
jgi:hypothetical protein